MSVSFLDSAAFWKVWIMDRMCIQTYDSRMTVHRNNKADRLQLRREKVEKQTQVNKWVVLNTGGQFIYQTKWSV